MVVVIPSPLFSYTGGESRTQCDGATLGELLATLDGRYPGIRFRMIDEQDRIRRHIRIYADGAQLTALAAPLAGCRELLIVAALSGG
jgi:molybdopterin converting factor small subunit